MEINWPGFRAPAGVNCLAQALDSANRRGTVKRNETVSIHSLSRGSEFGAKTGGRRRIDFLVAGAGASAGAVAWQHVQRLAVPVPLTIMAVSTKVDRPKEEIDERG